jgi:3-isopropylmalate/(R)-2-methylmalate dehydratase small subunit
VGAGGLRLQGDRRAELRRHLLFELHEDRTAAVVLGEADVRAVDGRGRGGDRPRGPGGRVRRRAVTFDIDPEIKYRLLNGLDDIGQSLEREADIDRFERERARVGAVTTQL